jgi:hypothetical protein
MDTAHRVKNFRNIFAKIRKKKGGAEAAGMNGVIVCSARPRESGDLGTQASDIVFGPGFPLAQE